MATVVFKCPQCGAPFEYAEGDRVASCGFCGMVSALAGDAGISRLLIPERLDQHAARSSVRKLLASYGGESYAASFSVISSELIFLPFWRIKGMALGWQWCLKEVFREEVDYDENGARMTKTIRIPDETIFHPVAKPLDITTAAGDFRFFGTIRSGIAAAVHSLEVMDFPAASRRGRVIAPLKGLAQARQEARALALHGKEGNGILRQESRLRIADEWHSLLYYPVWHILFAKDGGIYPVAVDAIGGEVTRCRFPGRIRRSPFLPLALVALLVWGFTTAPLLGVAAGGAAWWFLAQRYGRVDLHIIISCLLDQGEREAGVERG